MKILIDLKDILNEKFDICIIDTFPGVDTDEFVESVKEMCREYCNLDINNNFNY